MHSLGKMPGFSMLNLVVEIPTTERYKSGGMDRLFTDVPV
jgi:hypothetical protein